jgi:mRNA-degrading endonuclease RelE of RelBE toxin-antitoxin system
MVFRIELTRTFYKNLEEVMEFAANTLDNPGFAYKLWQKAHEKVKAIHGSPFLYPFYYRNEIIAAKGYRCAVVGDYLLFYEVNEITETITIHSFISAKRDLNKLFT